MNKEQLIIIVGPDDKGTFISSDFNALLKLQSNKIDVVIIGDGYRDISELEIKKALEEKPSTKKTILLLSHGDINKKNGTHEFFISKKNHKLLETSIIYKPTNTEENSKSIFNASCFGFTSVSEAHKYLKPSDEIVTTAGFDLSYGDLAGINFSNFVTHWKKQNEDRLPTAKDFLSYQLNTARISTGATYTIPQKGTIALKEAFLDANKINTKMEASIPDYGVKQLEQLQKNIPFNISVKEAETYTNLFKLFIDGNLEGIKKSLENLKNDPSFNFLFNDSFDKKNTLINYLPFTKNAAIVQYFVEHDLIPMNIESLSNLLFKGNFDKKFLILLLDKNNTPEKLGYQNKETFFKELKSYYKELVYSTTIGIQPDKNLLDFIDNRNPNYKTGVDTETMWLAQRIQTNIGDLSSEIKESISSGNIFPNAVIKIENTEKSLLEITLTNQKNSSTILELLHSGADINIKFSNGSSAFETLLNSNNFTSGKEPLLDFFIKKIPVLSSEELKNLVQYFEKNQDTAHHLMPESILKIDTALKQNNITPSVPFIIVQNRVKSMIAKDLQQIEPRKHSRITSPSLQNKTPKISF